MKCEQSLRNLIRTAKASASNRSAKSARRSEKTCERTVSLALLCADASFTRRPESDLQELIAEADSNRDGLVSFDDFCKVMRVKTTGPVEDSESGTVQRFWGAALAN